MREGHHIKQLLQQIRTVHSRFEQIKSLYKVLRGKENYLAGIINTKEVDIVDREYLREIRGMIPVM